MGWLFIGAMGFLFIGGWWGFFSAIFWVYFSLIALGIATATYYGIKNGPR